MPLLMSSEMNDQAKKKYEVSFLSKSESGAALVVGHLTGYGAEIVNEGNLSNMKLAYPINKQESAYFGCISCYMPTDSISKVHDAVRLDKEILRMLILSAPAARENIDVQIRQPMTQGLPKKTQRPRMEKQESVEKEALSNELLEEKLEEILK